MDKMGIDISFWEDVKAGKQNPFEKMVFPQDVKGAGQLASVQPHTKEQLPDEHTLTL